MAVKFEKFVNTKVEELDNIPKHDIIKIKETVREYHDKHNLVERNETR